LDTWEAWIHGKTVIIGYRLT